MCTGIITMHNAFYFFFFPFSQQFFAHITVRAKCTLVLTVLHP
jgi:hypothetical protein